MNTDKKSISDIQWNMLDKKRFYFFSTISSVGAAAIAHPINVIGTRLTLEDANAKMYRGTFDAFKCIAKEEGARALYRGVYVASINQCTSGLAGWTAYELVRTQLSNNGIQNDAIKSLVGGACSAFAYCLIGVPGEIIAQHMYLLGLNKERSKTFVNNPLNVNLNQSKLKISFDLVRNLYLKDGLRGFYRGLGTTLVVRMPSSSLGWLFFDRYSRFGLAVLPSVVPYTLIEFLAATSAGVTIAVLSNPLQVLRTQIQVKRQPLRQIVKNLYETEGLSATMKGVTARMIKTPIMCILLIFSHVTVKKFSIKEEYQDRIMW